VPRVFGKVSVFYPTLNFFSSAYLIVVHPHTFFSCFSFLSQAKRFTLLYAVLFELLGYFIILLAFRLQIDSVASFFGLAEISSRLLGGPTFSHMVLFFTLTPLVVLFRNSVIAGTILFFSSVSKSAWTYQTAFNLLCSLSPFVLWVGLIFAFDLLLFNHPVVLLFLYFVEGASLVLLLIRSFHNGAALALNQKMGQDPGALGRFYWMLIGAFILGVTLFFLILFSLFL